MSIRDRHDRQEHLKLLTDLLSPSHTKLYGQSFDGKGKPIVADPIASMVADAITNMLVARAELHVAKRSVPAYTGQWSDHDYVRDEQATYDQACNDLLNALKSALT